jgi:hypothetical protein
MAIGTVTAIALGVSAAASTAQAVSGAARASKAKKALENFQRQELKNVTEGMRVSTLGAELQTQEAQRRFATGVEALRSGGVRGVVGGLTGMEQQQQQLQRQISADLDQQQQAIEQARVQEEANIRSMTEQRESSQIAGLGAEIAAGRQQVNAGLTGLGQTALSAATMGLGAGEATNAVGGVVSGIKSGADVTSQIAGLSQGQAQRAVNRLDRQGLISTPTPVINIPTGQLSGGGVSFAPTIAAFKPLIPRG